MLAGMGSGVFSTLITHPLDTVRSRIQANPGQFNYKSTLHGMMSIASEEGLNGLYRGVGVTLVGNVVSFGLYYFYFDGIKKMLGKQTGATGRLSTGLIASTTAGVLNVLSTNPFWVVKSRMQLQKYNKKTGAKGFFANAADIVREEGVGAFWNGIVPSLWLVSHGTIQFTAYDELKRLMALYPSPRALGPLDYFVAGLASKSVAVVATNPLLVVRQRMMEKNNKYTGTLDGLVRIVAEEGPAKLWAGTGASLWKTVTAAATFTVYERLMAAK
eukprot:m51a1_g7059 putative ADT/ATP transporter (272) ;mRNA; f:168823-170002